MLDNQWKHGKVHLELPPLPSIIIASSGLKPISIILDNSVGEEIVLLITEPKSKVEEFEGREITRFMLKAGLVTTSFGPVCFLLYFFPNPLNGEQVTYENTINPKNNEQLSIYEKLSRQKYWHVVISDDSGEVANFFEFPNEYGLAETLNQVETACENMRVTDFMAAKTEYENQYTIDRLLAM